MMRATLKQKKLIFYINKKLKIPERENWEILSTIKTFDEADRYIKRFLPVVRFKDLNRDEIRKIILYIIKEVVILNRRFKTR